MSEVSAAVLDQMGKMNRRQQLRDELRAIGERRRQLRKLAHASYVNAKALQDEGRVSRATEEFAAAAKYLPGDIPVIGFTAEEEDRADDFLTAHGGVGEFPLIDAGLDKAACLALVERAGIVLPLMYRKGYNNANCIGCVKGGAGYWNKVRVDFPERFEEMAQIEDGIGPTAYLMRDRATGERISLRQLPPHAGRHDTTVPDCGFACARAEAEMAVCDA